MSDWDDDLSKIEACDTLAQVPVDREMIDRCITAIEGILPRRPKPADVMRSGWTLFDALAIDLLTVTPDCRKGCWFCCTLLVEISDIEARMLANVAARDPEVRLKVYERALRVKGLNIDDYTSARIRCAFLADDNTCRAYDVRPSACRHWHSLDVKCCEAGLGRPGTPIPLHQERVALFKHVMIAAGTVMGKRFGRLSMKMTESGELHQMTARALTVRRKR